MGRAELRARGRTPLPEALRRLRPLASSHVGIACELYELLHGPDEPPFVRIGCRTADGPPVLGNAFSEISGGASDHPDAALAAALGEAAERYSAAYVPADTFVFATAEELGPTAVDPGRFALYSAAQYAAPGFEFVPFESTTRIAWVEGFVIPGGAPAYLPAQLVYLAWPRQPPLIGHGTSNGLACGATLEEALAAGLLELLERDAFMITWANRLSLPLIDWAGDAALVRFEGRYLRPSGLEYAAVDLSAFWDVPTTLALVHDPMPDGVALTLGAASATTPGESVRKAFMEAFSGRTWAKNVHAREPERRFRPDGLDVRTFEDHVHYYADHERAQAAGFLDASADRVPIGQVPALQHEEPLDIVCDLADRLARRGLTAYGVDATAPDIAHAGLRVAKTFVPELCALDVFHGARFLGGRRLYEAAYELGLRPEPMRPEDVNPAPHPFP
jgi:ribosomal protein S12 methylthiotransferase accessory factor